MLFGDEPRFHKDLKATFAGGGIFAHVEVSKPAYALVSVNACNCRQWHSTKTYVFSHTNRSHKYFIYRLYVMGIIRRQILAHILVQERIIRLNLRIIGNTVQNFALSFSCYMKFTCNIFICACTYFDVHRQQLWNTVDSCSGYLMYYHLRRLQDMLIYLPSC